MWEETLRLAGVLFAGSAAIAVLAYRLRRQRKSSSWHSLDPDNSPKVRLLTPAGARMAHFVSESPEGIVVSPPVGLDSTLPLALGDPLFVQVPTPSGLRVFRSHVASRNADTGDITLATPEFVRTSNRRSEARTVAVAGQPLDVDGVTGVFINLSAGGAQFFCVQPLRPGDRVALTWGGTSSPIVANVLECRPVVGNQRFNFRARVCFSDPFDGLVP